ncbi:Uncharacterized protein BP5553_08073 [Venustampulla echinocandica]|uniref:Methyltransferase domain-containing protein n=1 Tax=Venustampulla echinocandica TaxID=2656787 RepID=A0A370TFN1_9HELO|nr:Uncharacterized protein BP5553_08073 [Venustampulla echinocandica]RDL33705.1 Uncharacterized protein BP5553_08073 [Venustampulla echinocandica]
MASNLTTKSTYSSNYERMSGNCTRLIAAEMVSTISPPLSSTSYILDNACGTGIVSEQIKKLQPDARIMATDISVSMIDQIKSRIKSEGWVNVETDIQDVRSLSNLPDNTFTHVITNMGLPVPGESGSGVIGAKEMYRILQKDGVAVLSTWAGKSHRVWLSAFYNTARAIRPDAEPQTAMKLNPEILRGSWLLTALEEGGFGNNVELRPYVTYTSAPSLDDLIGNLMLAKGMFFGGYSDEEILRVGLIFREEVKRLRTFEVLESGVARIGMKAWIATGWKKGYEKEIPL